MKSLRILALLMAAWLAAAGVLLAQEPAPTTADEGATVAEDASKATDDTAVAPEKPEAPEAPAVSEDDETKTEPAAESAKKEDAEPKKEWVRKGEMVAIGNDVHLKAGERTDQVVVIFGKAVIDGKVDDQVVVIGGEATINGPVNEVVMVLTNGKLGPDATVRGDAVIVGGTLDNPHNISVGGQLIEPPLPHFNSGFDWVHKGLIMGRPMVPDIRMTWIISGAFLAFYLFIALIFGRAVNATAATLETRPGSTLVASLLFLPALPVAIIILSATVIGVAVIPFLMVGVLFAAIFGKVAFLSFIGRAALRSVDQSKTSIAVLTTLVGGIIIALLYNLWYVGFALWALTTWIGIGMVVMTVLASIKRERPKKVVAAPVAPAGGAAPGAATTTPGAAAVASLAATPAEGSAASLSAPVSSGLADGPAAGAAGFTSATEPASAPPPPAAAAPVQPVPPQVTPMSPAGYERAGFGIRLAAIAIDIVLVGVGAAVIGAGGAFPICVGLYVALLWTYRATTVGGIVCGLKVVRMDGRPVDFATAAVRTIGAYLSLVCAGLGFLWVIWDPEAQTWHDKIAGTTVIRVPKGMSLV